MNQLVILADLKVVISHSARASGGMKTTKATVGKLDLVGETFYAEGERKASSAHSTEKWHRMRLEE